mmetsp:Transcript_1199/g.2625  ORF Transcript_1199/g.2625 Transcript_1199/m.2625 type:complete len:285 (+) Transcript_1199:477-1331(+)
MAFRTRMPRCCPVAPTRTASDAALSRSLTCPGGSEASASSDSTARPPFDRKQHVDTANPHPSAAAVSTAASASPPQQCNPKTSADRRPANMSRTLSRSVTSSSSNDIAPCSPAAAARSRPAEREDAFTSSTVTCAVRCCAARQAATAMARSPRPPPTSIRWSVRPSSASSACSRWQIKSTIHSTCGRLRSSIYDVRRVSVGSGRFSEGSTLMPPNSSCLWPSVPALSSSGAAFRFFPSVTLSSSSRVPSTVLSSESHRLSSFNKDSHMSTEADGAFCGPRFHPW